MSKGIGRSQGLILRALLSLEAQHGGSVMYNGRRKTRAFVVSAIVRRCWEMSPDLRAREQAYQEECRAAREALVARMAAKAEAGNPLAREWLMLDRSIAMWGSRRSHRGRCRERNIPWYVEEHLNPSRALASLAKRNLVWRHNRRGGGWACLTEEGRAAGRCVLAGRISVGTTLTRMCGRAA